MVVVYFCDFTQKSQKQQHLRELFCALSGKFGILPLQGSNSYCCGSTLTVIVTQCIDTGSGKRSIREECGASGHSQC